MLCKEYGIRSSTITDIKKREPALHAYKRKMTEMGVGRSAKIMKLGRDEELEAALFLWFKQKREEGIPQKTLDRLCRKRLESCTSG